MPNPKRMRKRSKHLRRLLIALAIIALLAGSLTLYGYIARQNPERMIENRIVKLEHARYIDLPALRFIGMAAGEHDWPPDMVKAHEALWERRSEFIPILDAMPEYAAVITDVCTLTHNNNLEHDGNTREQSLVGKFMRADAPVPEGFSFFDIPAGRLAYGVCLGEFSALEDRGFGRLLDKMMKKYDMPYPEGWFYAQAYFEETVQDEGVLTRMGFILPCESAEKGEFN